MTGWSYTAGILVVISLHACALEKKPPVVASGKAVVQAYVDAWNKHDSAALDTLLSPDVIHEDFAQNSRREGKAEVIDYMSKTMATQPDFKLDVTTNIEDGRHVALERTWDATYTGPDPTGKELTNRRISARGASFFELEKGKIKRITDYWDVASAFR